ncbi:MAG: type VI secretion system tube protein Hcp [Methanoregulaceae archaeon]|nr:type VI secretion system tube protein Hcp [Methanoregulaceae archaeon]
MSLSGWNGAFGAGCIALAFLLMTGCMASAAPVRGYLRIPGITEGCGSTPGYLDACDMNGFSQAITSEGGVSGGGSSGGRAEVSLKVVKPPDEASPRLMLAAALGTSYRSGSITFRQPGTHYAMDLVGITVTGVRQAYDPLEATQAGAGQLEEVTLDVKAIVWRWQPNVLAGWDFAKNMRYDPSTTPPSSVRLLRNTTYNPGSITWEWTDPTDADFYAVQVFIDGILRKNVLRGEQAFTATGLSPGTGYEIGTRTVDSRGNFNRTWVNATARTAPSAGDTTPPQGLTGIHNTSYEPGYITWDWTAPPDADFNHVQLYMNGVFAQDYQAVPQGYISYLEDRAGTYNTLSTRTVDDSGNVNQTWVNASAWTAPPHDTVPPQTITDLHETTVTETSVDWTWTVPPDADYAYVWYFIDDQYDGHVTSGTGISGLLPGTEHKISTRTVDDSGNMNPTWVNDTAWTLS